MRTLFTVPMLIVLLMTIPGAQPPYSYTMTDLKRLLPTPVIDDHPGWVDLYWRAWELAVPKIHQGTSQNGYVAYYMDEGFNGCIFQWDTEFMLMFARYAFKFWPSIISFDNFYGKQDASGYICREISESDGSNVYYNGIQNTINPPLFAWVEWEHYLITGDAARFTKSIKSDRDNSQKTIIQRLVDYYGWIDQNRNSKLGFYWNTGLGCGMDNSPKGGDSWIDMTAQMAIFARYLSKMATVAGDASVAATFSAKYDSLKTRINDKMWDVRDSIYYDLNDDGSFSRVKTIGSFWPLLAQICNSTQTRQLVGHLTNPKEFWRTHVFPSLSADQGGYDPNGGYWRGSVWAPTNYQCIKGLMANGLDSIAKAASENHIENMYQVYRSTNTIWENYASGAVSQGNNSRADFVGWSGCGPIALLIESAIGIRTIDAPHKAISWRIDRLARHGLQNFYIGDNQVSLVCNARTGANQVPVISVTTHDTLHLTVFNRRDTISATFLPGTYEWQASAITRCTGFGMDAGGSSPQLQIITTPGKFQVNLPAQTAWHLDLFTLAGVKIDRISGVGQAACLLDKKVSGKGFLIARLKSEPR